MGRPAKISRDDVVRSALAVIDRDGITSLTMARVAGELGVTAMALYRHVEDKADLLDGVVGRLLAEVRAVGSASLVQLARSVRAVARHHPEAFGLLLQRPALTEDARATRDHTVALLRAQGVPAADVAQVERLLSTIVLGFAASEASGRFRLHPPEVVDADFERLLELAGSWLPNPGTGGSAPTGPFGPERARPS